MLDTYKYFKNNLYNKTHCPSVCVPGSLWREDARAAKKKENGARFLTKFCNEENKLQKYISTTVYINISKFIEVIYF